ncbi:MAG TPA: hypothetical protein VNA66_09935 [Gammaproteobacteria bacterium]|nr:hypothetical protein [Gammaproteobacteria bacterium]
MNSEPKIIKERHWQTQALVDAFIAMKENEIADYATLATRCNMDVKAVKQRIQSAKDIAQRSHVVVVVHRGTVERLPQDRVHVPVERNLNRMRSQARRARRTIREGVTDFAKLSQETKSTLYMQNAIAGTVLLATDKASKKRLREHADVANGELNIGRTLELLK